MTIIVPPSRALSLRLLSRAATYSTQPLLRVPSDRNASPPQSASCSNASPGLFSALRVRAYATATPVTRAGRPKAHTGRASASKTKAATTAAVTITGARNTTAKKPGPKKPGPKKGASKATPKRKLKAKAKAKPKPKRKVLTEKQKVAREKKLASLKKKQLRETALLNPPKRLPDTAYQVVSIENFTKGTGVAENAKAAAAKYKSLEPEDREHANHVANENKAKNEVAYKRWLSTFTPLQVKDANNARTSLRRQAKAAGQKKQYSHIQDDRLVKQSANAYTFFLKDRVASGDMRGMRISEVGTLVAKEWKGLSAGDKKRYDDLAAMDRTRYHEEYKTVYGVDPPSAKLKATT